MTQKIKLNYLLPNLFTAASIFVAILSIILSAKGEFERASWFIILSLILDGLDGKIARFTKGESKFGIEFDSLADIIAFGVAPAMLIYFQIGINYAKFGILIIALYVIFGAIRLARFNITTSNIEPNIFIGLPIPAAALSLVSLSLLYQKYQFSWLEPITLLSTLLISLLMVSNIRYLSFKKITLTKSTSFKVLIALILSASLFYLFPIEFLNFIFFTYLIGGIARALFLFRKKRIK